MKTKTKPTHTPGPWNVTGEDHNPHWVQAEPHIPIAAFNFVGDGNQEANARLIAAAPKLLGVCKEYLALHVKRDGKFLHAMSHDAEIKFHKALTKMESAIAEAEGEK